mgnify:CR=1 FL=1
MEKLSYHRHFRRDVWYHESLCHPGMTRTEQTIRQHFTWKNLRGDVEKACKKCKVCQLTKRKSIKYGKLPAKEAESDVGGQTRNSVEGQTNNILSHAMNMTEGDGKK